MQSAILLKPDECLLVLIDVQGKLAHLMHEKEALFRNLQILIQGARALQVPVLWLEQNPVGLGSTIPELLPLLEGLRPIPKMSFSCCGNEAFLHDLRNLGRRQAVLAGIEAHVCVYQTALDLLATGYGVQVVADAVSSRSPEHRQIALDRIRTAGGTITCVETLLFEWLRTAEAPQFRPIARLVK